MNTSTNCKVIPLASASPGESARIMSVSADKHIKKRLLGMGLAKGALLHVVQKRGNAIVVGFDSSRIAIDSKMSSQIEVVVA